MIVAAVIIAGALGAVIRYLTTRVLSRRDAPYRNHPFPLAVLIVNVIGSAIGGTVLGLATAGALSTDVRLILITGFCGGLTTFSTFSVETIQLAIDGKWRIAALNVGANFVLGIGAAALAFAVTVALQA